MKTNPNDPATELTKREYMALHLAAAYMGADCVGNSGVPGYDIAKRGVEAADELIMALNRTADQKF